MIAGILGLGILSQCKAIPHKWVFTEPSTFNAPADGVYRFTVQGGGDGGGGAMGMNFDVYSGAGGSSSVPAVTDFNMWIDTFIIIEVGEGGAGRSALSSQAPNPGKESYIVYMSNIVVISSARISGGAAVQVSQMAAAMGGSSGAGLLPGTTGTASGGAAAEQGAGDGGGVAQDVDILRGKNATMPGFGGGGGGVAATVNSGFRGAGGNGADGIIIIEWIGPL